MQHKIKQAVILCGGKGVRLGELTKEIPKPLVPVLGKPVLDYIITNLRAHGITEVVLAAGHLGNKISDYYEHSPIKGCKIRTVIEPYPLGTAGAVSYCDLYLDDEFVVVYGDVLIDFDISAMMEQHALVRPIATIALWKSDYVSDPHTHIVELNSQSMVSRVVTERDPNEVYQNLCNAGIYVFNRAFISTFSRMKLPLDFGQDVFPRVAKNRGFDSVYGYVLEPSAFIKDMGTPERLREVEAYLKSKHA